MAYEAVTPLVAGVYPRSIPLHDKGLAMAANILMKNKYSFVG